MESAFKKELEILANKLFLKKRIARLVVVKRGFTCSKNREMAALLYLTACSRAETETNIQEEVESFISSRIKPMTNQPGFNSIIQHSPFFTILS